MGRQAWTLALVLAVAALVGVQGEAALMRRALATVQEAQEACEADESAPDCILEARSRANPTTCEEYLNALDLVTDCFSRSCGSAICSLESIELSGFTSGYLGSAPPGCEAKCFKLSGGAIAGIVIAAVALVGGLMAYSEYRNRRGSPDAVSVETA